MNFLPTLSEIPMIRGALSLMFLTLSALAIVAISSSHDRTAEAQRRQNQNQPQQPPPSAVRTGDLRKIDSKAGKVEDQFVKDAFALSLEYEKAGDLERAIEYLEAMLKIRPQLPGAKDKIEKLQDSILSANDFKFEIEASGRWGNPVAFVRQGKPFRIQARGQYKFSVSTSIGPDGFAAGGDLQKEMLAGIEPGKLAGLIVTNNKPGEPFAVGADLDLTPKESGILFLKVNVPPGSKCSGELDVELSGYVLSPELDNVGK